MKDNDTYIQQYGGLRLVMTRKEPHVIRVEKRFFFVWIFCFSFINPFTYPSLDKKVK